MNVRQWSRARVGIQPTMNRKEFRYSRRRASSRFSVRFAPRRRSKKLISSSNDERRSSWQKKQLWTELLSTPIAYLVTPRCSGKIATHSSAIGNSAKNDLKTSKRRIGAIGMSGSTASPQTVIPDATKLASTMRSTNIVCTGCRRRIRPMFPDSKSPRVQMKNDLSCAVALLRNFSSAGSPWARWLRSR